MPHFFSDECVAGAIVAGLRERGFDVLEARTVCGGQSDDQALAAAAAEGRIFITDDRGVGELAVRKRLATAGVVVLFLHALPSGKRESYAVEQILANAASFENCFSIVEPGRIRRRPLD
jgi:hypothetical protein